MVYLGKDQEIRRGHNVTKRTNNEIKSTAGFAILAPTFSF